MPFQHPFLYHFGHINVFIQTFIRPFIVCSLVPLFVGSLICLLIHSFIHPFIYFWFIHSLTDSFIHSLTDSFIHFLNKSISPFIYFLFIHSCNYILILFKILNLFPSHGSQQSSTRHRYILTDSYVNGLSLKSYQWTYQRLLFCILRTGTFYWDIFKQCSVNIACMVGTMMVSLGRFHR